MCYFRQVVKESFLEEVAWTSMKASMGMSEWRWGLGQEHSEQREGPYKEPEV